MDIRALIWDLGGVLVRTEDVSPRQSLADRTGVTRVELEELVFSSASGTQAQLGQIRADQHWKNVTHHLDLTPERIPEIQNAFWSGDRLDQSLINTIRSLRPKYKTALLSNAFSDLRDMLSHTWSIEDAFDEIVISSEIGLMKPDERIYKLILERLDVRPEEAVFIDDFPENIEGARKIKMRTILFLSTDQTSVELEKILKDKIP